MKATLDESKTNKIAKLALLLEICKMVQVLTSLLYQYQQWSPVSAMISEVGLDLHALSLYAKLALVVVHGNSEGTGLGCTVFENMYRRH